MSTSYHPIKSLAEFHTAFGQQAFDEFDGEAARKAALILRLTLIREEFEEVEQELLEAINPGGSASYERLAKELADLLYVVYGTAEMLHIPLETVFNAVHENNMSKLGPDGKPLTRDDGKFLKPPGYEPLNVARVLRPWEYAS
jgi:NTP pyrophosphatase (non-canonical NTP hydrolase)